MNYDVQNYRDMCKGWRAAICAAGVSTTAKIVALELMTYANPKQASLTCKQATLASQCNYHEDTVNRVIGELEAGGVLIRLKFGSKKATAYVFTYKAANWDVPYEIPLFGSGMSRVLSNWGVTPKMLHRGARRALASLGISLDEKAPKQARASTTPEVAMSRLDCEDAEMEERERNWRERREDADRDDPHHASTGSYEIDRDDMDNGDWRGPGVISRGAPKPRPPSKSIRSQ